MHLPEVLSHSYLASRSLLARFPLASRLLPVLPGLHCKISSMLQPANIWRCAITCRGVRRQSAYMPIKPLSTCRQCLASGQGLHIDNWNLKRKICHFNGFNAAPWPSIPFCFQALQSLPSGFAPTFSSAKSRYCPRDVHPCASFLPFFPCRTLPVSFHGFQRQSILTAVARSMTCPKRHDSSMMLATC